jgi:heat shock protein HslJ
MARLTRSAEREIQIGAIAATETACPPALIEIEQTFQTALAAVCAYTFDETGGLVLTGPGRERILARR